MIEGSAARIRQTQFRLDLRRSFAIAFIDPHLSRSEDDGNMHRPEIAAENNAGKNSEEAGFCRMDWTGNPLVDVGTPTLCAMNNRTAPQDLTLDDLDNAAREMEEYYFSGLLMSYLT